MSRLFKWRHCNLWRHRALGRNDLVRYRKQHLNQADCCMKLFQSVAQDLPNWGSMAYNFVKALTNTFMNFSFAFVSIWQSNLWQPQIKTFQPITTSCQYLMVVLFFLHCMCCSCHCAMSLWGSYVTLEPVVASSTSRRMTNLSLKPCSTKRRSFCRNCCLATIWWVGHWLAGCPAFVLLIVQRQIWKKGLILGVTTVEQVVNTFLLKAHV